MYVAGIWTKTAKEYFKMSRNKSVEMIQYQWRSHLKRHSIWTWEYYKLNSPRVETLHDSSSQSTRLACPFHPTLPRQGLPGMPASPLWQTFLHFSSRFYQPVWHTLWNCSPWCLQPKQPLPREHRLGLRSSRDWQKPVFEPVCQDKRRKVPVELVRKLLQPRLGCDWGDDGLFGKGILQTNNNHNNNKNLWDCLVKKCPAKIELNLR